MKGKQRSSLQLPKNFSPPLTREYSGHRSKVSYLVDKQSHTLKTQPTQSSSYSLQAWGQDNAAQALAGLSFWPTLQRTCLLANPLALLLASPTQPQGYINSHNPMLLQGCLCAWSSLVCGVLVVSSSS